MMTEQRKECKTQVVAQLQIRPILRMHIPVKRKRIIISSPELLNGQVLAFVHFSVATNVQQRVIWHTHHQLWAWFPGGSGCT